MIVVLQVLFVCLFVFLHIRDRSQTLVGRLDAKRGLKIVDSCKGGLKN